MFKKIIISLVLISILTIPVVVLADNYGIDTAAGTGGLKQTALSQKTVPQIIGDVVGVLLSLLGIIFFLLVLYAGFLWMTALGSQEKATKAKDILEAAIIGLLIVLAAYAITKFVFTSIGVGGGATTPTSGGTGGKQSCTALPDYTCVAVGSCFGISDPDGQCPAGQECCYYAGGIKNCTAIPGRTCVPVGTCSGVPDPDGKCVSGQECCAP